VFCTTQLQSVEAPTSLLVPLLTFSESDSLSENENIFKRGMDLFIVRFCEKSKGNSEKAHLHNDSYGSFILLARRTWKYLFTK